MHDKNVFELLSSLASWELAPRLPRCLRYIIVLSSLQPAPWLPGSLASYRRTAVSAGSAGAGSLAPCELTLHLRAVFVSAGSLAAGSLAPWELTSYLRTVVVSAGSLAAGSVAPWELTSILRSRLRGSRLPGSLRAYVASSNSRRSRLLGSRLPGSL